MNDDNFDNSNRAENGLPSQADAFASDAPAGSDERRAWWLPDESRPSLESAIAAAVDPALLAQCINCGLCTASCPTFLELGDENDGPRGRIQIVRLASAENGKLTDRMRRHLELCLDCRACETACPFGVQYGRIIEPVRAAIAQNEPHIERRRDWFRELIVFRILPYADRIRKFLTPIRFLQHTGLYEMAEQLGLLKIIPGRLGRLIRFIPPPVRQGPKLPRFLPAVGRRRARVAFFTGCVSEALFRHSHWATLRVLQQNGCDVFIPTDQGCCGALHYHSGDSLSARQMADANLIAFELDRYDAILVNHGTCGAMLKQYGQIWQDGLQPHREKFASKVRDVHEFLDELGLVPPGGAIRASAVYHDACYLAHAQKITAAPRRLLEKIPGLDLRDMSEADVCCGMAGVYGLQEAEMSDRLAQRKLKNILNSGASIALAADPGCLLQLQQAARNANSPLKVMHTMELLDLSYRFRQP